MYGARASARYGAAFMQSEQRINTERERLNTLQSQLGPREAPTFDRSRARKAATHASILPVSIVGHSRFSFALVPNDSAANGRFIPRFVSTVTTRSRSFGGFGPCRKRACNVAVFQFMLVIGARQAKGLASIAISKEQMAWQRNAHNGKTSKRLNHTPAVRKRCPIIAYCSRSTTVARS